jgi:hypothetical protein
MTRALSTLISKLISIIRSNAPAQLVSSAHNKIHFQTLYPFYFLELYPLSNVPLPEGQAGTAWEPSKLGGNNFAPPFPSEM